MKNIILIGIIFLTLISSVVGFYFVFIISSNAGNAVGKNIIRAKILKDNIKSEFVQFEKSDIDNLPKSISEEYYETVSSFNSFYFKQYKQALSYILYMSASLFVTSIILLCFLIKQIKNNNTVSVVGCPASSGSGKITGESSSV